VYVLPQKDYPMLKSQPLNISGWYEGANGVELFYVQGETLRKAARALVELTDGDCIGVDLEATGEDGEDLTPDFVRFCGV